ncbi:MAG: helix-turn-helix domain-containing protein [Acidobacteria bacterium]|jgi:excisionase family DNA binding protein|nr:helix-turn-helix domain-containing protein [Acidobacteriota bacterium]
MQKHDAGPPHDALIYSEPHAARMLGLAPETLRKLRSRGLIAAVRIGRRVLYERRALEQFVAEMRRAS